MAAYTTEQLFSTRTDQGENDVRSDVDFGQPEFSFTVVVPRDLHVWTQDGEPDMGGEPLARLYYPERRDEFMVEVHRIKFPGFAEAITAGHGFLARQGYNRILRDAGRSNNAFGLLAGAVEEEGGTYGRMARLATVSRGRDVLFVYAYFDYDDYEHYEPVVSRLFGTLRMNEDGAPAEALETVTAPGGTEFLVPSGWIVTLNDKPEREGASDYSLSLPDQEYPNIQVQIRPDDLETGRQLGVGMIEAFNRQIEENDQFRFVGDGEQVTHSNASGETVAYSYARSWDILETEAPMVSEFHIQKNADSTLAITAINAFDGRRKVDQFDDEIADLLFRNWVVGLSAYAAARMSLLNGLDGFRQELDIRAVQH